LTNANDTASVAATYAQRGWAVIPVRAGAKMPIERDWPNQGRRTAAEVRAAWELYPDANVGIVTGRVSGLWVLDIDPQNGGMAALAGLIQAYGKLPETYVVRTPTGGLHYYFLLPEDFEPRNAQHGRVAGRLPVGIDVRGRGGQVVAPPSSRPDGSYVLINDFPLSPAPEWLLDMIRPIEPPERTAEPTVLDELRVGRFWDAWIKKVFTEELQRLAGAPEGARDDIAIGVALRLVEICNSSWNDIDLDDVFPHFMRAAQIASDNGSAPYTQGEEKWRNAIRRRAGLGVPPPASLGITGTVWTPPVLPPVEVPTSDFDQAGQDPANPFTSPGAIQASVNVDGQLINGPVEQAEVLSDWDKAVAAEGAKQLLREAGADWVRQYRDARSPIQIMDREALRLMPRSQPLIAGWLGRGQTARLYGPPGAGKSFVAIEMSACIAQGLPWHGYATHQGEVVYFAVEDAEGVALRLRAWEMHRETEHQVHVVSTPVQMNVPTVRRVLTAVRAYFGERRLAMIVLDTQAMVTIGMDENSAQDMGVFVEAVKLLAAETGATVLTVHHSGVKGGRARGSTSIRGAMDVEIEASMAGVTCTMSSTKQKNVGAPPAIMASLNIVDVGEVDELGTAITSCVLLAARDATGPFTSPAGPSLSPLQRRALAIATALVETAATGETYSRLRIRAADMTDFGQTPAAMTSSFSRAWAYLVERGRIAKAPGRESFYFIDVEGQDRLSANPFKAVAGGPEVYVGEVTES
jgi:hypothetical protein